MYIGRVRGWAGTGCGGVESTVGRAGPGGALRGAVGGIQSHCPGEGAQQGRRGAQAADQRTDGGTHYSPRGAVAFALESQACLLQCIFSGLRSHTRGHSSSELKRFLQKN